MTQTPRNHRNIIIASIVVAILLISLVVALIEYNQMTIERINLFIFPNQTDILQGSSSQFTVIVNSIGNAGDITLSSNVGSSGLNCTFEPAVGTSNFT